MPDQWTNATLCESAKGEKVLDRDLSKIWAFHTLVFTQSCLDAIIVFESCDGRSNNLRLGSTLSFCH